MDMFERVYVQAFLAALSEARSKPEEELEASLEWRCDEGGADRELLMERPKEDTFGLLADLATARAKRDEVVDDAKVTILVKQNLEKALLDANMEVISLRGWQLEVDSSLHSLAEQGERAREKVLRLLAKLVAAMSEAKALHT
ncbi:hypothetical protein ACLOJK_040416 [Asimina triloba]